MTLARIPMPRKVPKAAKRASRWRSPAHCAFVRSHACATCGSTTNVAAAHVRFGSGAGIGQKPDDWRVVPLCDGPHSNKDGHLGCHDRQHIVGEQTFWRGLDVEQLIADFIAASPKAHEIKAIMRERG